MQPFDRNRYGPKIGGLCPFRGGGAGSPPNTMWPGPRPTYVPSFILIRPTVWPQYTNDTDRQTDRQDRQADRADIQDRQRTDSIGRTVLQTVAQKSIQPLPLSACVKKTCVRVFFFVNISRSIRLSVLRHAYRSHFSDILTLNGSYDAFLQPLLTFGGHDEILPI